MDISVESMIAQMKAANKQLDDEQPDSRFQKIGQHILGPRQQVQQDGPFHYFMESFDDHSYRITIEQELPLVPYETRLRAAAKQYGWWAKRAKDMCKRFGTQSSAFCEANRETRAARSQLLLLSIKGE